MKNLLTTTMILLAVLFTSNLFAQAETYEKDQRVIVTMKNGAVYTGSVEDETETELSLLTDNAKITLKKEEFKKVELDDYKGDFLFRNSHSTRYFYSPSAIPLKKGEGYYQNMMLVGNVANVGITNNFSIGGGFEFISLVSEIDPIFTITPKFGFKVANNVHLGLGVRVISFDGDFITSPYAAVTLGHSETNVSIVTGANVSFDAGQDTSFGPTVMSASHRVSNRISLMTENWFWNRKNNAVGDMLDIKTVHLGMHGMRLHTRKSTFDFGVMTTNLLNDNDFGLNYIVPIPYVGYSYAFSLAKKK